LRRDGLRPAIPGRALARKGRHGHKQPFDIMHKVIMWLDPTSLILGEPRRASKGSQLVGGVVTRAGSTFIDEDEVITKAGSTYTGNGQTTTTAGNVVLKPGWSTR
jgi:hypothetical protein